MKKKKHTLRFHTRKNVFSMYWIQIASILPFYTLYFVLKCIFKEDTFIEQFFLSLVTEITICYMAYKKAWSIGDFHSGEVLSGGKNLKKRHGVLVGVLMIAPIWGCSVISSVFNVLKINIGIFDTVLNLFTFRWSNVVGYLAGWTNNSPIVLILFYIGACLPIIVVSAYGFKNGYLGIYPDIKVGKNHAPRYENEGARDIWDNWKKA
ncbi:MAG: hypothetical protein IKM29_00225 [Clostridia bacterium]|nr:hypothetical protein [Clostridia bacterium]